MFHPHRRHLLAMVILSGSVLVGRAGAVAPEIKDEAKFFSAEAIKKANKQIREIARKYDRDLLIETFPLVPGDQTARVKAMAAEERDKFFRNWAENRAELSIVKGVYIMQCKEPAQLKDILTQTAQP